MPEHRGDSDKRQRRTRKIPVPTGRLDAVIFDMDGVVSDTARVHERCWKRVFDDFLRSRSKGTCGTFRPFDDEDYLRYVDGKPRYDGVESFLASRQITLERGTPSDPPGYDTVCALGNLKDRAFEQAGDRGGRDSVRLDGCVLRSLRSPRNQDGPDLVEPTRQGDTGRQLPSRLSSTPSLTESTPRPSIYPASPTRPSSLLRQSASVATRPSGRGGGRPSRGRGRPPRRLLASSSGSTDIPGRCPSPTRRQCRGRGSVRPRMAVRQGETAVSVPGVEASGQARPVQMNGRSDMTDSIPPPRDYAKHCARSGMATSPLGVQRPRRPPTGPTIPAPTSPDCTTGESPGWTAGPSRTRASSIYPTGYRSAFASMTAHGST